MGLLILTIIDYYCPPYHDVLTNPNPINSMSAPLTLSLTLLTFQAFITAPLH